MLASRAEALTASRSREDDLVIEEIKSTRKSETSRSVAYNKKKGVQDEEKCGCLNPAGYVLFGFPNDVGSIRAVIIPCITIDIICFKKRMV